MISYNFTSSEILMNREIVISKLEKALSKLIENDEFLLICDANERSISHRLAVYLEQEFDGWDIDCEYNRNLDSPKRLNLESMDSESADIDVRTVFPDIIIHQRGTNNNLLVIEMKKTTSSVSDDFDFEKLAGFKKQLGYLTYPQELTP